MDSQPETPPQTRALSGTLTIAAISAGVFFFSYCYALGYALSFGIPYGLIDITWINTAVVCAVVVLFLGFWVLFNLVARRLSPTYRPSLAMNVLTLFIFLLVCLFLVAPVVAVMSAVPPAIIIIFVRPSVAGVDAWMKRNQLFAPLILLLWAVLFFSEYGRHQAQHQTDFYVVPTSPESVLLAEYGNTFVLEHFDRENRKLDGDIVVMKLADGSPLTLERENVGPLSPPKEQGPLPFPLF